VINVQSAAIPYRNSDRNGVEVLLVTSRKRSKWVLPKGRNKPGQLPHRSAAREAFEEGGVLGTISAIPIGIYRQMKTSSAGDAKLISVHAFPMLVSQENLSWPEMQHRQRRWMTIASAIKAVKNSELKALLANFEKAVPDLN
jgi:8-oxo-dGTP pyrophosphatase MutT (NUDIX family)